MYWTKMTEFSLACWRGDIEVVNRLLELNGPERPNIHTGNDEGFRWACEDGHIEVVNRLLELKGSDRPNIHARNDDAFRYACLRGE
jgi:ankyrin repeat protein